MRSLQASATLARPRTAATHDANGRKIDHNQEAKTSTGSASAAAAKRRAEKPVEQLQRESASEHGGSSRAASTESARSQQSRDSSLASAVQEAVAVAKVSQLEQECCALREALLCAEERAMEVEQEVRSEASEEMAQAIALIREDYKRQLRARSTSVAGYCGGFARDSAPVEPDEDEDPSSPVASTSSQRGADLCKSARKEQCRDELERYVESLEEQFEETEAELERVRADATRDQDRLRCELARAKEANALLDGSDARTDETLRCELAKQAARAAQSELEADDARQREAELESELEDAHEDAAAARADAASARKERDQAERRAAARSSRAFILCVCVGRQPPFCLLTDDATTLSWSESSRFDAGRRVGCVPRRERARLLRPAAAAGPSAHLRRLRLPRRAGREPVPGRAARGQVIQTAAAPAAVPAPRKLARRLPRRLQRL